MRTTLNVCYSGIANYITLMMLAIVLACYDYIQICNIKHMQNILISVRLNCFNILEEIFSKR